METIHERISYIKGIAEGIDFYNNSKEGKIYSEMIQVITDLNRTLENTTSRLLELEEYVEAIDEDLNDVEWDFYEEEDDLDDLDDLYEIDDDDDEGIEMLVDDEQYQT